MIRRPPSYSDSFLVLPGTPVATLAPLVSPPSPPQVVEELPVPPPRWGPRIAVFIFKGGLHVLFISAFETAFYFLYVSQSENEGIVGTINTYYQPLVRDCAATWSNTTRWLIEEILTHEVNVQAINAAGASAEAGRLAYNHTLLVWSSLYSVICFVVCLVTAGVVRWRGWTVPWRKIFMEHILFVTILGLYEVFFFRTVIYNYDTMSTAELNRYIVDGLAECAAVPGA